jgi:hypothetical protein
MLFPATNHSDSRRRPHTQRATTGANSAAANPRSGAYLEIKRSRLERTRTSHQKKQNPVRRAIKQADLDTLKLAEQEGLIELKYLDEAGFCLWSPVSYSYSPIGEQKRMEQTKKRSGNRISILGLWQPGKTFEYALAQGGFKGKSYIQVMDWVALKAAATLAQTGRLTVIVSDNNFIGYLSSTQNSRNYWTNV